MCLDRHRTIHRRSTKRPLALISGSDAELNANMAENLLLQRIRRETTLNMEAANLTLEVQNANIKALDPSGAPSEATDAHDPSTPYKDLDEYNSSRAAILAMEKTLAFDGPCRLHATGAEARCDQLLLQLRDQDRRIIYQEARPLEGFQGQLHRRLEGDHFLSNVELISESKVYRLIQRMPKGSHLHLHFNSCLHPSVLLGIAKEQDHMCIISDLPLVCDNDFENYEKCEIQFSILAPEKERPGSLFSHSYQPRQTMRYREFLSEFSRHYSTATVDEWLQSKLQFHEKETHNLRQTAEGAWEKFNGRTRMMKGLFNYETAYRKYTRLFLRDLIRDNIQYAEIRPNFMSSNQLWTDDGTGSIDNRGIMKIIIEEVECFQKEMKLENRFFMGIKVIYCTPRSFSRENVKVALDECIEFKKEWPNWIAGFDLLGEEMKGHPIKDFLPELLDFRHRCDAEGLDIPFLFHAGETLENGTETDQNLVDALLLNSKRIGHGFALSKHPYIMQHMKARNICVELCPISNEILGLTPRVSGHRMYELLANNIHCTVNADNGTLFRSTLSHDFYQVLMGKEDMGLYGLKQLCLWSIEHSCLDAEERQQFVEEWEKQWGRFVVEEGRALEKEEDG